MTPDKIINIEMFDFSNVTILEDMFACENAAVTGNGKDLIERIKFPKGNAAKALETTSCLHMFKGRLNLKYIDNLEWFAISPDKLKFQGLGDMFYQVGMETIDIRSMDLGHCVGDRIQIGRAHV